ncbi:zinc ribbon domain-containing protein [bacterium]|nr:zinc ribbon domain-containing protein [bacterium]
MKCKKCGAELHEDQKVCIACGTRTIRGDNYEYDSQVAWRPSRNMWIAAAGVVVLVVIAIILNSMRTVPPKDVANEWFSAMTQRKVRDARELSTPRLEEDLQSRGMDLIAISEEYYGDITSSGGSFEISNPKPAGKNALSFDVSINYNDGEPTRGYCLEMVKVGRQWRVDKIM